MEAGGAATVLICESNQALQSMMHTWLWGMGVNHKQVYTAESAVAACAQNKYELIVMDLDKEWQSSIVATGLAAVRSLRQMDGPNKYTPIVGWTTNIIDDPIQVGINDTLSKPIAKEAVEAVIQKWVGQQVEPLAVGGDAGDSSQLLFDLDQLPLPDFIFSEEPATKSASVLVVEDCKLTQHVITSLLKELTPHVNQAFDGEEGINMCDTSQYDIIFMDMNMPKINGLQATQRIRKSGKNTWVPIIAFTSTGKLEDYRSFGVDDMLQKPFSTESLASIFDKWTEHTRTGAGSAGSLLDSTLGGGVGGGVPGGPTGMGQGPPQLSVVSAGGGVGGGGPALTFGGVSPSLGTMGTAQLMPNLGIPGGDSSPLSLGFGTSPGGGSSPTNGRSPKVKKDAPRNAHNKKERQRRQDISSAADDFSKIVPTLATADKATVFKRTVEYVNFLQSSITKDSLAELNRVFAKQYEGTQHTTSARRPDDTPKQAYGQQQGGGGGHPAKKVKTEA